MHVAKNETMHTHTWHVCLVKSERHVRPADRESLRSSALQAQELAKRARAGRKEREEKDELEQVTTI